VKHGANFFAARAYSEVWSAAVANAKTPAFVRMTGMACNQCHVSWSPTPDLTFTGLKFRLNGYRTPFVAEKIEAGEEGAMNGKRLVLGLQNAWNLHYRSNLFSQSKGGSDPSLPAPAAGPVASQPFSRLPRGRGHVQRSRRVPGHRADGRGQPRL
jgi:hypothetical protein